MKHGSLWYAAGVSQRLSNREGAAHAFEAETVDAISRARTAFSRMIEFKCPGSRAVTSVAEAFGVHRKLAWQVSKVAYADDPFAAARHMPPAKSLDVWLQAARNAGVDPSLIESARDAGARFESLAETHASSRAEFQMLLESCVPDQDDAGDAKWRQQAFLGNSYTWGAHCRTLLALSILMPSDDRERFFHAVQVRGLIGFRQTRPGVRWVINQSVVLDDESKVTNGLERVPLDPGAAEAHAGVPVLPAFCSTPTLEFERRSTPDGIMQDEFLPGPIGQSGERTLVTAEVIRNIGAVHATEHDRTAYFGTSVRTPAELLHFDLLVRDGLFGPVERELRVFSDLTSAHAFGEHDELKINTKVVRLGRGLGMAQTPDIPAYAELVASVCDAAGIDPDEYELFRVRMAYPPMPTSVMLRHDLLDPDLF